MKYKGVRSRMINMLLQHGKMSDSAIADGLSMPVWRVQCHLSSAVRAGLLTKLTRPYEKPAMYFAKCLVCKGKGEIKNGNTLDICPSCGTHKPL